MCVAGQSQFRKHRSPFGVLSPGNQIRRSGKRHGFDTGAASAERRSPRRKARPTTVSNIEELLSMGSSRSTKKVSCLRRKRFSAARAPCERTRFRANARALTKAGTIFESRRKTAPFHGYNDVGSRHPFATKRPILAGLNCGINDGSSFCGAQLPWCTTPIEAESSLGPDSHHPSISLSGIPSAVMVLRILHPILASTLCAANPLARITEPTIAL